MREETVDLQLYFVLSMCLLCVELEIKHKMRNVVSVRLTVLDFCLITGPKQNPLACFVIIMS